MEGLIEADATSRGLIKIGHLIITEKERVEFDNIT